ncbi:MAG: hypothetical protein V7731_16320 [Amphritea sp.]
MATNKYKSETSDLFIQPTTGRPRTLKKGAEDEVITLLRLLERLHILTDFDAENYNHEFLINRLKCCQQQHSELAEWARRLLQDSVTEDVVTGELFGEEQQLLDLPKPE